MIRTRSPRSSCNATWRSDSSPITGPSGTKVIESSCRVPSDPQYWYYVYAGRSGGSNYYNLVNYATLTCLDVEAGSYAHGAQLTTSACCAQCTSQWWRQQGTAPAGATQLRNLPSGKCIDMPLVPGSNNVWNGQPIGQWSCGSFRSGRGANQFWILRR
ncbi:RICIN domain-containing protein [Stenotrophomonas maltophilia]|uniref:RICIN domain-containing protein n=1 Tax=Stenotrophomonas hibiscicola TaxID=86189 RepID=UPI001A8D40B9|nr:RICIN domain-containing protein [Stenotrophomonas maltophilia]